MKAFGYVRLSKWEESTTSPQRQREAIEAFCKLKGWELTGVYEDIDVSAYNGGRRPGLDKALARMGEVDAIVFMRLDRLTRSMGHFTRFRERCEKAGVALVFVEQDIDTSTAVGKAMVNIIATFAELESGQISERAKAMHAHLKKQGRHVGRPPFGWRMGDKGKLVLHPEEHARLEDVARRYVAGESLRSISADVGMGHANLARMLRTSRVIDSLPPPLGGALARNLAERGREGTRAKRSLLGGIARCAVCGSGMTISGSGARTRGSYACRNGGHVSIARHWLDDHVSTQVLDAIDTGALIKRIEKRNRPRRTLASSELEARLELLDRDYYELGRLPEDRWLRLRDGLLRRLKNARDIEERADIDLPRELAADLGNKWQELSLHGRRRIIGAVLERVEVSKAANTGRINPSRVRAVWRA